MLNPPKKGYIRQTNKNNTKANGIINNVNVKSNNRLENPVAYLEILGGSGVEYWL
jgi:hypothetical protein